MTLPKKLGNAFDKAVLVIGINLAFGTSAIGQSGNILCGYDRAGNLLSAIFTNSAGFSNSVFVANSTIWVSNRISLSAIASGTGLTYQWRLNGADIVGATNATFYKTNATGSDGGAYSVVVSGGSGPVTNDAGSVTVLASRNSLYGIAYGFNRYVAVGARGTVVSSSNLTGWSSLVSNTTDDLYAIAFGNNRFIAVGNNRTFITSTNGVSWTIPTTSTNHMRGIAYGNGVFVGVGTHGKIFTTVDGFTLYPRTTDTPTLNGVTYGTNLFVTVGTSGTIWTSSDGTNWVARTSGTTNNLNAVAYGNSLYTAVGANGIILTSPNGITWTPRASGTTQNFTAVTFHNYNSNFVAVGPYHTNIVSADGLNWGASGSGTHDLLLAAFSGNGTALAAGANGTILKIQFLLLDHFKWTYLIASPQQVNGSFYATLEARDAAGNVTPFNGVANVTARTVQRATNTILGNVATPQFYVTGGPRTLGYTFTPSADLTVTHVRHTSGKQVTIWSDGALLARVPILDTGSFTAWTETPLSPPLKLSAGLAYMVTFYTTNAHLLPDAPGARTFPFGTINASVRLTGTNEMVLPLSADAPQWFFVDLKYTVEQSTNIPVTPATANFVDGYWGGWPAVQQAAMGVTLQADDGAGHRGVSNPFDVLATNDLVITGSFSPNDVTLTVVNSRPNASTGVIVTNILPPTVTYFSPGPVQGPYCSNNAGVVTCELGNLGPGATTNVTILFTRNTSGVMATNIATVGRNEPEPNLLNNRTTLTIFLPPVVLSTPLSVNESHVGIVNADFQVSIENPTMLGASVDYSTLGASAIPASDYIATNGTLVFPPGVQTQTVRVLVKGDTLIEGNEVFYLIFSNPTNAWVTPGEIAATIIDDDGLAGQVHYFTWNEIPAPQRTNQPFAASLTAKDASGATATSFNGNVSLLGIKNVSAATNSATILGAPFTTNAFAYGDLDTTFGYSFTPSTNIVVTHVRHCSGASVSLWTDTGTLLLRKEVVSTPGTWLETALNSPVVLSNGVRYRLGFLSTGQAFYRSNLPPTFLNGSIHQSYYAFGDSFPMNALPDKWMLVDLRYFLAANLTPTSVTLANGTWTDGLIVRDEGIGVVLRATDNNGHIGLSNPFEVLRTNDLAVTMSAVPSSLTVKSNLTYTLAALNSGPDTSTGVTLTNTFSPFVTFVSATPSQGSCSYLNGVLTCNLGALGDLARATVTVVATADVASKELTNIVSVGRTENELNLANNTATLINWASPDYGLLIAQAVDREDLLWSLGGDQLWFKTNDFPHDGIDVARAGLISHNQQTWIETAVYGPGTLTFWWVVHSQLDYDFLRFYIDGQQTNGISGTTGIWGQQTNSIGSGWHTLRWAYTKDATINSGLDSAWLDQVVWTIPSFNLSSWLMQTNGQFKLRVNGATGQRLAVEGTPNFIEWSPLTTNVVSGSFFEYSDPQSSNYMYRLYRARHAPE